MKPLHPATIFGLLLTGLLLVTTSAGLWGFSTIHARRSELVDLYQLKSDILQANIALRNAALATNAGQAEVELNKMLVTRASANEIYDRLSASELSDVDKIVLREMKAERPEYREAQLRVVSFVRKGLKEQAWDAMPYYQTLMDRYLARVDKLIGSITHESHKTHQKAQAFMFVALALSILTGMAATWRIYK